MKEPDSAFNPKDLLKRKNNLLKSLTIAQNKFIFDSSDRKIFEYLLEVLLDLTDSEYGFIGEVRYDKKRVPYLKTQAITNIAWSKETQKLYDDYQESGLEFRNLNTLFGKVMVSGEPLISNSPYTDPRRGGLPKGHPRMDSFLGIPFSSGGRLNGMVGIANRKGGYDQVIIEFLEPFLSTCSSLIEGMRQVQLRKDAEMALLESEGRFRRIIDTALDAVIIVDEIGNVVSWNKQAVSLFGWKKRDALGKNLSELIIPEKHIEGHLKGIKRMKKYFPSRILNKRIELEAKKKNGYIIPIELTVTRLKIKEEVHYSAFLRDITERKKWEDDMQRALVKEKEVAELRGKFVSMASHQFRTPLAVIQSNMELLTMKIDHIDPMVKNRFNKVSSRIQTEVHNLTSLMNDVLVLGRYKQGKPSFRPEWVDCQELCREILDKHARPKDDNRRLWVEYIGDPIEVELDKKLILHAMSNLITNALKYSQGKPSPKLSLYFQSEFIKITLQDFGIGIHPEDRKNLFQNFFRGRNTQEIEGTGLGLVIAKEFIELHNGRIELVSKLDKGSTFIVYLPIKQNKDHLAVL